MPPEQQPQNPYGQAPQPGQSPNGPYPVMPAVPAANNNGHSGHNPYDFIIAQNQPKKGFPLPGAGGNSFAVKVAVFVGGGVLLVALVVIVASLLSPQSGSANLTEIAQRQTEIARIAELASDSVDSQEAKNFVANVSVSVGSGQQQVVSYLADHGTTLKPEVLALANDPETDDTLTAADTADSYDTVAAEILTGQLTTYTSLLQTAYKNTGNDQTKQLLSDCYASAQKLLAQAEALGTTTK